MTFVRRSCLTGKIVWIYRGPSVAAAKKAYWRACERELKRVKNWSQTIQQRVADIEGFISVCMSSLSITDELTPTQANAARQLQAIRKRCPSCHMDFYDHIVEERRRRAVDREIRRKMRSRKCSEPKL